MKREPDDNAARLHSCAWSEDGRTLIALFDLADGGTALQQWTPGSPIGDLRRVDAMPPPFVPRP